MATATASKTLAPPAAVKSITSRETADTYDWDTAFALHFNTANTSMTDTWSSVDARVKKIDQAASDDPSYNITANLSPWQLHTGGDGKNINMIVPVSSGTYTAGSKSYPLDSLDMQVIIQINMDWIPNPDQLAFVINSGVDGIRTDLEKGVADAALIAAFAAQKITLTAATKVSTSTVNEVWLINGPDSKNYYVFYSEDKDQNQFLTVYQFVAAWASQLAVLRNEAGGDPAVIVMNVLNPPSAGTIGDAVLPELLSEWFNTNITYLNYVFASLDLSPLLAKTPNYTWIDPTSTNYAVTDNGTLEKSVFGVLTMVQGNTAGSNHQVSPNAIPTGTDAKGADSGFLISGPNFIKNMMLSGARYLFNDATQADFDITNDGLTVCNNKKLTYGKFKMDDSPAATVKDDGYSTELDKGNLPSDLVSALQEQISVYGYSVTVNVKGSQWLLSEGGDNTEYIVDLTSGNLEFYEATIVTIAPQQFEMTLEHSYLEIKFIDLTYAQSWRYDIHINYTEQVSLGLKDVTQSDGTIKQIFSFTQSVRNMTVNVTKTKADITFDIVMGAVTAALSLIAVLGPVIDGLASSATVVGEISEEGGEMIVEADAFAEAFGEDSEGEANNAENEENALSEGTEQVLGRCTRIKNAFNATRWKVFGFITAAVGAVYGVDLAVEAIMEAVYTSKWEDVPGFDDFAQDAIAPYSFPGVKGYDLKSAWLADSLQIGLKTK